ncbi:hypothetical protein C7B64_02565 [Merismopedia glauca CCAP 1448/3]|uniref:Uncharacterized protein n=1 Tax=Merismopedia glauca CCAP 1448/3 TaxID=1296344 RepID=A0A2T1C9A8_9CYAN|nr:hypothetical protein C7B64_02565 [Merismopedia glauca CCAP 1448/3]
MLREFGQIIPVLPPRVSIFASYQVAYEFRREVEYRQALDDYCQWYRQAAEAHQQEFQKLKRDINIVGWFNQRKR